MKERPIIFTADSVKAILAGTKTQTRRVIKPVRGYEHNNSCRPDMAADPWTVWWHGECETVGCLQECPHGKPGDRLWVRETWWQVPEPSLRAMGWKLRPSIFMPRTASRLTLEIESVRVQRLQEISEEDARAEGATPWSMTVDEIADLQISDVSPEEKELARLLGPGSFSYKFTFQMLWDELNKKRGYGWDTNPFVWCLSFRRVEQGAPASEVAGMPQEATA